MTRAAISVAAPEQLFLPMFLTHEVAVMRQAYAVRIAKRIKARIDRMLRISSDARRTEQFENLNPSLLDLPLGPIEDKELSTTGDPLSDGVDEVNDTSQASGDERMSAWSDVAIDLLHEATVMYSLRLLNARGNGKEKKEILSWIFDPHALAYVKSTAGDKAVWGVIKPTEVPFSFDLCCRLSGLNPERIREGLVPILKQMGLGQLFNEVENERDTQQRIRAAKVSGTINIQYPRSAGEGGNSGVETGTPRSTENRPTLRLRSREVA
jgi:hypothetical protein